MRLTAAVILLTVLAMPAWAADEKTVTWYDVEIIVFKHAEAKSAETWPPDAGLPDIEGARSLYPDADPQAMENEAGSPQRNNLDVTVAGLDETTAPMIPGVPDAYT